MRVFAFIFLFYISHALSLAQSKSDQLIKQLDNLEGEDYVNAVFELFEISKSRNIKSNKSYNYSNEFINYLDKAKIYIDKIQNEKLRIKLDYWYFNYYGNRGNFKKALTHGRLLLSEERSVKPKDYYEILEHMSLFYNMNHMNAEYFKIMDKKYIYAKKHGFNIFYGNELIETGSVYYRMKQYQKAIERYKKGISDEYTGVGEFLKSSILNNIGICYQKLKKIDSASLYFSLAIEKMGSIDDFKDSKYKEYFKTVVESNRAKLLIQQGDYITPIPFIKKEITGAIQNNEPLIAIGGYNDLASCYLKQGKPLLALEYSDKALGIPILDNKGYSHLESWSNKAKALLTLGKVNQANALFDKLKFIKDSLSAIENKATLEYTSILYEVNQKEKKIIKQSAELSNKNRIITEQNKTEKYLLWFLGLVLILVVIGIVFYLYSLRVNRLIKKQQIKLESALEQRELLLRETHHRVKNNLQLVSSLLNLQQESNTEDVIKALGDSQNRVLAMSMIHHFLYDTDNISAINFREYTLSLLSKIHSIQPQGVSYDVDIDFDDEHMFDLDTSIPLGLILNELITNSYKHVETENTNFEFALKLKKYKKSNYRLTYRDNGVEIKKDFQEVIKNGFGLRLATRLATQLNGKLNYNYHNGNIFTLTFSAN